MWWPPVIFRQLSVGLPAPCFRSVGPGIGRQLCLSIRRQPIVPGLEGCSKPPIVNVQVTVRLPHDGIRLDGPDLLRKHANIDLIAPIILEAIKANATCQAADPNDVVLQLNI